MKTKHVVYAALIGALYYILVIGLAPISFDILQFRWDVCARNLKRMIYEIMNTQPEREIDGINVFLVHPLQVYAHRLLWRMWGITHRCDRCSKIMLFTPYRICKRHR